jgi:dihydrofolate reductase
MIGIYATASNGVIGQNNKLPWSIPKDLSHFRELTQNHIVIMGRKTYDGLPCAPRGFSNRINIVLTREPGRRSLSVKYTTIEELPPFLEKLHDVYPEKKVFVIGGATIFELLRPQIKEWYITRIHKEYSGDTIFSADLTGFIKNGEHSFDSESPADVCKVTIEHWVRAGDDDEDEDENLE